MKKKEARCFALEARKEKDVKVISKELVNNIINSKILEGYNNIGIYYPIGKELDVMELVNYYSNKTFYLPITRDEIHFVEYTSLSNLVPGKFNTMEPVGKIVPRDNIDCFIIPCVAISKDNKRIGYGQGYYDRYLEGYKGMRIGICHKEASELDVIMNDFDVVLNEKFTG